MGYVYLIGTTVFGWYKIGKSKTPDIRIKNLGILLPFKIKVIAIWKAENHHAMEKALHELYKNNTVNGEWFEFTSTELDDIDRVVPSTSRVYPGMLTEKLSTFSNIQQDTKQSNRVLGLRVQKLRGNFTPEERDARRIASMEQQRIRKEEKKLHK